MRINRFIKKLFFSSNLYDFYLKKDEIQDIAFTPKDAWPVDPLLGESLVQGHYDLAGKKVYSPSFMENYGHKQLLGKRDT